LVFLLSTVNVMNTAFCSIISLCDKPRGLNQSCRLELSGTTFLLHHCVIHNHLLSSFHSFFSCIVSFFFSFFCTSFYIAYPLSSSVFIAFFLTFLSSFPSAFLCPVSRFFLSSLFWLSFSPSLLCFLSVSPYSLLSFFQPIFPSIPSCLFSCKLFCTFSMCCRVPFVTEVLLVGKIIRNTAILCK
jgi:hypothetical protein